MLTKSFGAFFALFAAMLAGAPALADDGQYEVGQVWTYEAQEGSDDATLVIQRIDRAEDTDWPYDIYHISLFIDVPVGEMDELAISHLPVSRETLDQSTLELSDRKIIQFADWRAGYNEWERANGGVFTIGLADIIEILAGAMTQQTSQTTKK